MKNYLKNSYVFCETYKVEDENLKNVINTITEQITKTINDGIYNYITFIFPLCSEEFAKIIELAFTQNKYPHTFIKTLPSKAEMDDSISYYFKIDLN